MKKLRKWALALAAVLLLSSPAMVMEAEAIGSIHLRVADQCTRQNVPGIAVRITGNDIDKTAYDGDDLKKLGLKEGYTYTFSASHYGYAIDDQQITMPQGSDSSADVNFFVNQLCDLTVKVQNSLGQAIPNQEVRISSSGRDRTYKTGSDGTLIVEDIRGVMGPAAETTYNGVTVSGSTGGSVQLNPTITLTIPIYQEVSLKLENGSAPITQAAVTLGDTQLNHVGNNVYQGAVLRTAETTNLALKITAKGYQTVTDTLAVGASPVSKTYTMQTTGITLVDSNGAEVGDPQQLQTGYTYTWSIDENTVPEGATCSLRDTDSQLATYVTMTQNGLQWNLTPIRPTDEAITLELELECKVGNQGVTSRILDITVAKGTVSTPNAPSIDENAINQTSATFQLPSNLKLAQELTVTATGAVSERKIFTDLSQGTVTMALSGSVLRGEVTFSFDYKSAVIDYTGTASTRTVKFYQQVPKRTLPQTEYAYTGSGIKPVVSGEEIASISYGSYTNNPYLPMKIQNEENPWKLTQDNTLSFSFMGGTPSEYKNCPYGVEVKLKEYYTVEPRFSGTTPPTSYELFYTIVPRPLTVTAEDQTIPYAAAPADNVRAGDGQLLDGHHITAEVEVDAANGKLNAVADSVKVWNGTEDVTKYYNVTQCVPGALTTTKAAATTVEIQEAGYARNYTYGETIPLPDVAVTGAYKSDVQYRWTNAAGKEVAQPRNVGTYTLTAYTEENENTRAASDTITITIGQKKLTVSDVTATKVYDGSGSVDGKNVSLTFNGLLEMESLAYGTDFTLQNIVLTDSEGKYNAGTGYELTAEVLLARTERAANYALATASGEVQTRLAVTGTAEITRRPIDDVTIAALQEVVYKNAPYTPDIHATYGNLPALVLDTDYTLDHTDNVDAGTAKIQVTGKGNFSGSREVTFTIAQASLEKSWLTLDAAERVYDGTDRLPTISVKNGTTVLVEGTDYTLLCNGKAADEAEVKNVGTYTLSFTGTGNYKDSFTQDFRITKRSITIKPLANQFKTYGQEDPTLQFELTGGSLSGTDLLSSALKRAEGEDAGSYAISLAPADNNPNYTITLAEGTYVFEIRPLELKQSNSTIAAPDVLYDGTQKDLTPTVTVTLRTDVTQTLDAEDYTITGNRATAVGTYTMTLTGKGNFSGSLTVTRKITPDQALLTSVAEGSLSEDNVSLTQQEALELLKDALDTVTEDTVATAGEKALWENAKENLPALLEKLDALEEDRNTDAVEQAEKITPDKVTAHQENTLEQAKEDLQDYMTEHAQNITAAEEDALEAEIAAIDRSLAEIEKAKPHIAAIDAWVAENASKADADELEMRAEYEALVKTHITDLTDANTKRIVEGAVKTELDAVKTKLYTYKIISGSGSKWIRGSGKALEFKANGAYSLFDHLLVDGKKVSATSFTASAGSTVIQLKSTYLTWLTNGTHTIQFVYSDGKTDESTFQIARQAWNPTTGDYIMTAVVVMALSAAALAVLFVLKKRKK